MPTAVAAPVAAHMDDIKGFVLDEQRTITYKWLSSSLAVSADVAKRLLFQFAEDNKDAVRATYLLSGWTAADGDSVRARRFIIAKDEDLEQAVASLETLSCAHVYSVTAAPGGAPSASALWATESAALWDMFNSAPEEKNCLRDNRHGHIKCSKVVRDLQPRQLFPYSPGGPAGEASRKPAAPSPVASKESDKLKDEPAKKSGGAFGAIAAKGKEEAPKPKLSAAEQRFAELATGGGGGAVKVKKLSMAEQRMAQLAAGGGKSGGKASGMFGGAKGNKKEASKKAEESDSEDEAPKAEERRELGFQFDFEKKPATKKASPKKKAAGRSEAERKRADRAFINDESEEEADADEASESEAVAAEEPSKKSRVSRRRLDDSDSEEEATATREQEKADAARLNNKYAGAFTKDSDDAAVDKPAEKEEEEEEEEEDSGDESDSSHDSQHTNASEPGSPAPAKAAGKNVQAEDDGPANGVLVITKRRKGADGEEEEVEVKGKKRRPKKGEDGEEKKARKGRKKKEAGSDAEEGDEEKPKKARKRKEIDVDANQKTLDVSAFANAAAPVHKRTRKVERTAMDAKGYLVTEIVTEEVTDDEGAGDAPADEESAAGAAKPKALPKALPKPAAKPAAKKEAPAKKAQSSISSFFTKK